MDRWTMWMSGVVGSTAVATAVVAGPRPIPELDVLIPAQPSAGQWFGNDIAVDGDRAVIGSPADTNAFDQDGSVYVFERQSDETWLETAKLTGSAPEFIERLGLYGGLSIDGTTIAAGAPHGITLFGLTPGRVYMFELVDGTWGESAIVEAPMPTPGDSFGSTVILSGDRLFVGSAEAPDEVGAPKGAVFIYERDAAGAWNHVQTLQPEYVKAEYHDSFGESLAYDADEGLLLVGDSGVDVPLFNRTGAVYAFRLDAGQWVQEAEILPPDPIGDEGGIGISLWYDDDQLLVGDIGSIFPHEEGRVVEFRQNAPGDWTYVGELQAVDAAPNDRFGTSIRRVDDTLLVSVAFAPVESGDPWDTAVDVFSRDGDGWSFVERINPAVETASFGGAMATTDGGQLLAGEYLAEPNGLSTGAVRVYDLGGLVDCFGDLDGDSDVGTADLLTILASWGTCTDCPGDLNADGIVGIGDLLSLLAAWGPCAG